MQNIGRVGGGGGQKKVLQLGGIGQMGGEVNTRGWRGGKTKWGISAPDGGTKNMQDTMH